METPKLITVAELAEITKIKKSTIRKHFRIGKIVGTKIGKSIRFTQQNVNDYINQKSN